MKYKDLGKMLSKEEMKGIKGGYKVCEPPLCGNGPCPSCDYECVPDGDFNSVCRLRNES